MVSLAKRGREHRYGADFGPRVNRLWRGTWHDTYAKHCAEKHSAFGFHVDPLASSEAVKSSGLGNCDVQFESYTF
jgi:hypothetical protein